MSQLINTEEPIYSIYLSGKITGDPNYLEKFWTVAEVLHKKYPNAEIFNPASELLEISEMLSRSDATEEQTHDILVAICLKFMKKCQGIAIIPGWCGSSGTSVEVEEALSRGMKFVPVDKDWLP